jgi:DNA polymerase-3 subunit delta'
MSERSPVLGQAEAEATLMRAWRRGRLHHAWLLTGPAGIGKATLARQFARTVLAGDDPDGAGRRVSTGTHADLLVVTRATDEKRQRLRSEIVIDDVRPVGAFLHRTAAEGGWRVVIIDGAEHLNRNAANALLKLLEEPPSRALILLACAAPGRLPATIRSRCRTLRLTPLDPSSMQQVLERLLPDMPAAERQILITLGDGSPGRAIALAADDGVALSGLVDGVLSQHGRPPGLWSYQLADTVLRHDRGFSTFIGLLCAAISTTMRSALRETDPARPPEAWAGIGEELARLRDETESLNLDKRQALLTGLSLLSG